MVKKLGYGDVGSVYLSAYRLHDNQDVGVYFNDLNARKSSEVRFKRAVSQDRAKRANDVHNAQELQACLSCKTTKIFTPKEMNDGNNPQWLDFVLMEKMYRAPAYFMVDERVEKPKKENKDEMLDENGKKLGKVKTGLEKMVNAEEDTGNLYKFDAKRDGKHYNKDADKAKYL
jgi:hypothetical protein